MTEMNEIRTAWRRLKALRLEEEVIRLTIPFAVWSKSVDNGSLPQVQSWLRQTEELLECKAAGFVEQLLAYGTVYSITDADGLPQLLSAEDVRQ